MAQYETYQSNSAEIPIMRKWVIRALILSLVIHGGLIGFFNWKKLENFGYTGAEKLAPPPTPLRQVSIPDLPAEEVKLTIPDPPKQRSIEIPNEKPMLEDMIVTPTAPEVRAPVPKELPKVELSGFDTQLDTKATSMDSLEKQLLGDAGSSLDKSLRSLRQPTITVPIREGKGNGGIGSDAGGIPGRPSLDEALKGIGGAVSGKPIAMQGGALFEWGKADLRPEAVANLQKLGELIRRNPKSTFIISGHTDHTGAYETNLMLSQQRADSVRDWLVMNLGIDPARITTIGKADTEAFPTLGPDKSVDEQAPNRRVEIVIKTNRK